MEEAIVTTNLRTIQEIAHNTAREKGFWEDTSTPITPFEETLDADWDRRLVSEKIALIHSEVSEALEELRDGTLEKFGGELADIIIRTADLAGAMKLDLAALVVAKLEANKARPVKHGKRF